MMNFTLWICRTLVVFQKLSDIQGDIINQLKEEEKSVKKIEDAFGLTGKSLGVVNKMLGGALPDLDKIKEGARGQLALLEKKKVLYYKERC